MAVDRGISGGARDRARQDLAIVVVEVDEARAAGENDQHYETGDQMHPGPAHNAYSGMPPETSGEVASRRDPSAGSDQHEDSREQGDRGKERDTDRNRQC